MRPWATSGCASDVMRRPRRRCARCPRGSRRSASASRPDAPIGFSRASSTRCTRAARAARAGATGAASRLRRRSSRVWPTTGSIPSGCCRSNPCRRITRTISTSSRMPSAPPGTTGRSARRRSAAGCGLCATSCRTAEPTRRRARRSIRTGCSATRTDAAPPAACRTASRAAGTGSSTWGIRLGARTWGRSPRRISRMGSTGFGWTRAAAVRSRTGIPRSPAAARP